MKGNLKWPTWVRNFKALLAQGTAVHIGLWTSVCGVPEKGVVCWGQLEFYQRTPPLSRSPWRHSHAQALRGAVWASLICSTPLHFPDGETEALRSSKWAQGFPSLSDPKQFIQEDIPNGLVSKIFIYFSIKINLKLLLWSFTSCPRNLGGTLQRTDLLLSLLITWDHSSLHPQETGRW